MLGLIINGFALVIMLLATFSSKTIHRFLDLLLKFMRFIKTKNYDLKKKKLEDGIRQYEVSAKYIKGEKKEFVKAIFRVFIQIFIYHSIPYFIYKSFGLNDFSFFQLFSMQAILYTTVSGIPIPGSIGVSESLFLKLYRSAFGGALLSGAMLLYRFVSFYLYIAIFAAVVVVNAVKTKDIESELDKNVKEVEKVTINKYNYV